MWWHDRCWRGIEVVADAGEVAMILLRDPGTVDVVGVAHDRHLAHLATFFDYDSVGSRETGPDGSYAVTR
jgi:hypothetical protein